MTNEQLATLLQSYVNRLDAEIDSLRETLPDEAERYMEWWDKGKKTACGVLFPDSLFEGSPDRFEERPTGDFVILDGLLQFVSDLEDAIEALGRDGLMGFAVHDGDLANAPFEFLVNASDVAEAWRLLRENAE